MTKVQKLIVGIDTLMYLSKEVGRTNNIGMPINEVIRLGIYKRDSLTRQEIRRLHKRKLLHIQKRGHESYIRLTNSGKVELIVSKANGTPTASSYKYLVIYDIPESAKVLRRSLPIYLRRMGCEPMQRSVWGTKRDIGSELIELVRLIKVRRWVRIIACEVLN